MNDLPYLIRQMKAPRIAEALSGVAEQARREEWSYEDFLAALLEREVLARQAQGGEARIRAAHFPSRKTVEDFDFTYQPECDLPRPTRHRKDPPGDRPGAQGLPGRVSGPVCHSHPVGHAAGGRPP